MQVVILQTVPLSIENSESCSALLDVCHAVIKMILRFLRMKPDIDKVTNSRITLKRLYESDEDFKSAFLLGGEKQDCGANMLCVHTAFGQFSLNLVWTSRIPTPLANEHLMVEIYRGCVNGFIQRKEKQICRLVYLRDYFIKGMRAVSKTVKFTLLLQSLEVLQVFCP